MTLEVVMQLANMQAKTSDISKGTSNIEGWEKAYPIADGFEVEFDRPNFDVRNLREGARQAVEKPPVNLTVLGNSGDLLKYSFKKTEKFVITLSYLNAELKAYLVIKLFNARFSSASLNHNSGSKKSRSFDMDYDQIQLETFKIDDQGNILNPAMKKGFDFLKGESQE